MKNFAYDIQLGFLAFPLVALLLAVPYMLYQYRRFGAISLWKTFVVFTFILYCLCAVSLIVFPLPADHTAVVEAASKPQLHPFNFVDQIRATTDFSLNDRSTWGPALKSPVVYEAIFNVMLTIPLGAYLCYLFRCRWWMTLLIGIATTLLFETSQLTGLFGLYAHPYRLFDVDDLMLNTAGTMIGFWLMIPIAWALPSMTEVNERSIERGMSRASVTRRALALVVDLTITVACFTLAWLALSPTDAQIAKALAIDPSRADAKTLAFRFFGGLLADPLSAGLVFLAIGAVLFAVVPMFTKGRTIGKAIVGLRIVKADGSDAPLASYWVRFGATVLFCLLPFIVLALMPEEIEGVSDDVIFQMVGLVAMVWVVTVIARAIGSMGGKPYVSLSEVVSGTRIVPSKQVAQNVAPESNGVRQANNYAETAGDSTRQEPQDQRQRPLRQTSTQGQTPETDDYGKQAALDSLLDVNYDEQHPTPNENHSTAPTQSFVAGTASTATSAPTQVLGGSEHAPTRVLTGSNDAQTRILGSTNSASTQALSSAEGAATELISDPEVQRKIRRDQRPDAGGTQAFKRQ